MGDKLEEKNQDKKSLEALNIIAINPWNWEEPLVISVQWTECTCPPPNSYFGIPVLRVMVVGGMAFGESLGHEGDLMNKTGAQSKETPESSVSARKEPAMPAPWLGLLLFFFFLLKTFNVNFSSFVFSYKKKNWIYLKNHFDLGTVLESFSFENQITSYYYCLTYSNIFYISYNSRFSILIFHFTIL